MIRLLVYCWVMGFGFMIVALGVSLVAKRRGGKLPLFTIAQTALYYGMGVAIVIYTFMYLITGTGA